MLVVDRKRGTWSDAFVRDLPALLDDQDCLVLNNTRVMAARLHGRRIAADGSLGGGAEILVLKPDERDPTRWQALLRPGRRLPAGSKVQLEGAVAEIGHQAGGGTRWVAFQGLGERGVAHLLSAAGRVPLPPYIRREDDSEDHERYQTVYASQSGSVAAPTAGLHFDEPLLTAVRARGTAVVELTLHVGLGTFRPVTADRVEDHDMHAERFEVSPEVVAAVHASRRTVAVGTTAVRALEASAEANGTVQPTASETDLFITPGYRFRAVDAMLTNFHLPRSTLLMLVAAFAGHELVLAAYAHAVREKYRFYSYGDCMLIT